ncbi:MAG: patatin-like phospholipase family protein [Deltaproteobacteria bacterium]|nr:patatin-like phospholipase family protein [Deltaproteobacteria bacterium]
MRKKIHIEHKQKIALVASGGAIKAACFHIGVCIALEKKGFYFLGGTKKESLTPPERKLPIQTYVGSSAGSVIVALLASGYTLRDIVASFANPKKANKKLPPLGFRDLFHIALPNFKRLLHLFQIRKKGVATGTLESLIKNVFSFGGFFTTVGIEQYMRLALPTNCFQNLSSDLFVVASQLDYSNKSIFCKYEHFKARPEHHAIYDGSVKISQACAASTALPPIYRPYLLKSRQGNLYYFDGEIRETLSTHVAKDMKCDLVLASYTHQPYHYTPEIGSLADYGISYVMIQAIYQLIEQKIHTSKRLWQNKIIALDTVNQFFKDHGLPEEKRKLLCEELEKKLQFNKDIHYIFIHPLPEDYALFLSDHFSLSESYMIKMVQSGFKSAIYHLRNYEFHI